MPTQSKDDEIELPPDVAEVFQRIGGRRRTVLTLALQSSDERSVQEDRLSQPLPNYPPFTARALQCAGQEYYLSLSQPSQMYCPRQVGSLASVRVHLR